MCKAGLSLAITTGGLFFNGCASLGRYSESELLREEAAVLDVSDARMHWLPAPPPMVVAIDGNWKIPGLSRMSIQKIPSGHHTITFLPNGGSADPFTVDVNLEAGKRYRARAKYQYTSSQSLPPDAYHPVKFVLGGTWSVEITEEGEGFKSPQATSEVQPAGPSADSDVVLKRLEERRRQEVDSDKTNQKQ